MEDEARDQAQPRFHVTYIGQAQPVEVYFAVYDGTLQAEALSLVGRKLRAALLIEGELPQVGLATQELDDGDLMLTLARRLAAGEREDTQALESLFAESRALEAGAGEILDGSRWAEEANPAALSDLPDTLLPAAAAFCEPGRQLTLLSPPQDSVTPAAAILHDAIATVRRNHEIAAGAARDRRCRHDQPPSSPVAPSEEAGEGSTEAIRLARRSRTSSLPHHPAVDPPTLPGLIGSDRSVALVRMGPC